jgi:FtsH-binding integral membrane protein
MRDETYTIPEDRYVVADLGVDERAAFIARTYGHLFGAILAFIAFEILLFRTSIPEQMIRFLGGGSWRWLLFLGAFMIVGWLASGVAARSRSPAAQYGALAAYVAVEGLIFAPLLFIANRFMPGAIASAAAITGVGFTALTGIVFLTRKDFSFLRGILGVGFIVALLLIVGGAVFGFNLGLFFSVAMVALASGAILYNTSNVMHHYPPDRHVSAALELFAAVALLFWYVLRLVMELSSD